MLPQLIIANVQTSVNSVSGIGRISLCIYRLSDTRKWTEVRHLGRFCCYRLAVHVNMNTNELKWIRMNSNEYVCCCCHRLAVASLHDDHDWQCAPRDPQVVGCCHSRSGQPICCEDDRDGDAIGCLVVGLKIGWLGSWVPCEPGRHLAAWPHVWHY